ncbi:AAA family ATPase [Candidatus Binatia bacterium]|nr:AAA family ATPase [Candidatus Binatia bacterium]
MAARSVRDLEELVRGHRIVVCAGSGGVGKTTTAATIALWGALQGRNAIVLTIDPARRLADSLGVGPIGNTPVQVPDSVLATGASGAHGTLAAMMLDQKGSWDELVERHVPNAEARQRILENRFYQQLSQSFAGSQEYMAVEQLGELDASGRYDLIVVDTPPTQHALDFLEAPERLLAFLDRKIVKWFVRPSFSAGWSTLRTMNRTVGFLLHKIEDATGVTALADVTDFFSAMTGLFEDFEPRVQRVTQLLRDPATAFVLVAGPDEQVLDQADYLAAQMSARGMPLKGVVMNRVHRHVAMNDGDSSLEAITALVAAQLERLRPESPAATRATSAGKGGRRAASAAAASGAPSLAARLAQNFVAYQARARGDELRLEIFRQGLPRSVPLALVPNLESDIHDVAGLLQLHPFLFARAAS